MNDESVRYHTMQAFYQGLSDEDRKLKVEARITDILAQYGGKRLVAGKVLNSMVQDLTKVVFTMKNEGLI